MMLPPTFLNLLKNKKHIFHQDFVFLLIVIILYNLSSGLFPDDKFQLPVITQNIIAYFVGFTSVLYYYFFVAKYYNIGTKINLNRLIIILFANIIILFVIPYTATHDLTLSRKLLVVIPISIGIYIIYSFLKKNGKILFQENHIEQKYHIFTGVISMISILSLPLVILLLGDNQDVEQSLFNMGFFFISIEYFLFQNSFQNTLISKKFSLTQREQEILSLLILNPQIKHSEIADTLFLSEKTNYFHMNNIRKKTNSKTKEDVLDIFRKN